MKKILIITSLAFTTLKSNAQDTTRLNEVEILSTSLETNESDYKFTRVISAAEIKKSPAQTISELLKFQVGIDVRQRAPYDIQTDVSLRGGTFDQTLIMIDGIPMNDPQTGHHNMNLPINLDAIEKIEVIYNGGSFRYGPYAFSGVINIITKSPDKTSAIVEIGAGEYALYNGRADVSYAKKNSYYNFNFQRLQSDGYLPNSDFFQNNFQFSGGYDFGQHHVKFQAAMNDKGFGAQNFYTSKYPDQYEATRTALGAIQYAGPLNNFFNQNAQIYWRRNHDRFELFRETGEGYYTNNNGVVYNDSDTISWYHGPNYHRTDVQGGEYRLNHTGNQYQLDFGVDARREYILSNNLGIALDKPIAVNQANAFYTKSDERTNSGIFVDYRRSIRNFKVRLGARYNYNTAFGNDFFPSIDVTYALNDKNRTWVNANRSFRLPTFTDLYYSLGGAVGSANLRPEYSTNFEIGHSFTTDRITIQAALYRRLGTDMIDWTVLPGDSVVRATNLTDLNLNGTNINMSVAINDFIRAISVNASYQWADQEQFNFESLYALDYLKYTLGAQVVIEPIKHLSLTIRMNHLKRTGTYFDFASQTATEYSAVNLLDAKIQYTWRAFNIYVEANNLLDKTYYDRGNVLLPGRWVRSGIIFNIL